MERIVERGLLYDFYGELLTAHQKDLVFVYSLQNKEMQHMVK